MSMYSLVIYILIGGCAGVLSGLFGIGGGVLIAPSLIYIAGYPHLTAIGTSLAILLPPISIAAVVEYYNKGHVNVPAAIVIASALMIASWMSARFTFRLNGAVVRLLFGIFLVVMGGYTIIQGLLKK
ncbi:MAG: sulfite exporter TauE/SafE family protein [Chitinispirillaceae bacterium]|nr:sulfite exporter TauE/SafE family protein [Chitinispirillaceae bacterium]